MSCTKHCPHATMFYLPPEPAAGIDACKHVVLLRWWLKITQNSWGCDTDTDGTHVTSPLTTTRKPASAERCMIAALYRKQIRKEFAANVDCEQYTFLVSVCKDPCQLSHTSTASLPCGKSAVVERVTAVQRILHNSIPHTGTKPRKISSMYNMRRLKA